MRKYFFTTLFLFPYFGCEGVVSLWYNEMIKVFCAFYNFSITT